jgi:hypothetical protein
VCVGEEKGGGGMCICICVDVGGSWGSENEGARGGVNVCSELARYQKRVLRWGSASHKAKLQFLGTSLRRRCLERKIGSRAFPQIYQKALGSNTKTEYAIPIDIIE